MTGAADSIRQGEAGGVQSRRNDDVSRWKQGAARIGISYRTYRTHAIAGERWCSRHGRFLPSTAFRPTVGYDRNTFCISCRSEMNHEYYVARNRRSEGAA